MLLADTIHHLLSPEDLTIVTADAVAELYYASPHGRWSFIDYPSVMPPFDNLWVEFRAPAKVWTKDGDKKWPPDRPSLWAAHMVVSKNKLDELRPNHLNAQERQLDAEQTTWSLGVKLYVKFPPSAALVVALFVVALDAQGHAIAYRKSDAVDRYLGWLVEAGDLPEELQSSDLLVAMRPYYETAFLAISFMHCRNVALQPRQPSPRENQLRLKKNRPPLLTYKTLMIDHMREVLRTEGGMAQGNSLKRAMHICRGHFAHYTPDAPLFGRVVGTFWIPQHVKGSADRGVISKTYAVK